MSESWGNDGDNSKKSRSYSREFTNQSRYNDRRQNDDRRGGRGRRDDGNSNYGRQFQSRDYNQGENSNRQQYGRNQYSSESNFGNSKSDSIDTEEITLQIQTCRIGKLIGRGGSTVKDLQNQSGCRISVKYLEKLDFYLNFFFHQKPMNHIEFCNKQDCYVF